MSEYPGESNIINIIVTQQYNDTTKDRFNLHLRLRQEYYFLPYSDRKVGQGTLIQYFR